MGTMLLAALLALAPPIEDRPEGDSARLQGRWKAATGTDRDREVILVFQGKQVSLTFDSPQGERRTAAGEYALDESARPKQMTWTKMKLEDRELPDNLAIYEFGDDGKTLKIAGSGPDKERPKAFTKDGEGPPRTIVFAREPDEAKAPASKGETKDQKAAPK